MPFFTTFCARPKTVSKNEFANMEMLFKYTHTNKCIIYEKSKPQPTHPRKLKCVYIEIKIFFFIFVLDFSFFFTVNSCTKHTLTHKLANRSQ